jgi:hypothetical protein
VRKMCWAIVLALISMFALGSVEAKAQCPVVNGQVVVNPFVSTSVVSVGTFGNVFFGALPVTVASNGSNFVFVNGGLFRRQVIVGGGNITVVGGRRREVVKVRR